MSSRGNFDRVRHIIATQGVAVLHDEVAGVGHAYTVGLAAREGHPELIMRGLAPGATMAAASLLNELAYRVRDGVQRFEEPCVVRGLADGLDMLLSGVPDSRLLRTANEMYRVPGRPPVSALELHVPVPGGGWLWEVDDRFVPLGGIPDVAALPVVEALWHDPEHEHCCFDGGCGAH